MKMQVSMKMQRVCKYLKSQALNGGSVNIYATEILFCVEFEVLRVRRC